MYVSSTMTVFCAKFIAIALMSTAFNVESHLLVFKPPFVFNVPFSLQSATTHHITTPSCRPNSASSRILYSTSSKENDNTEIAAVGVQDKARHVGILDKSLKKLTGRGVYDRMGLPPQNSLNDLLTSERYVLISHGTQDDPIYNFGNTACLQVFCRTWQDLCQTPSAKSVVNKSEDEGLRKKLMQSVTDNGYVEGATGIRITGDGRLIRLIDAVVWNCYDENGDYYGQAAFFDKEKLEDVQL